MIYSVQEPDPEFFYLWKINAVILGRGSTYGVCKYRLIPKDGIPLSSFPGTLSHIYGRCSVSKSTCLLFLAVQCSMATFSLGNTGCY